MPDVLVAKQYVFARHWDTQATAWSGVGYLDVGVTSPERALWQAQQQPWPVGTDLGVADRLDVNAVTEWVPAARQVAASGVAGETDA